MHDKYLYIYFMNYYSIQSCGPVIFHLANTHILNYNCNESLVSLQLLIKYTHTNDNLYRVFSSIVNFLDF